jgi:replicative DNA helicase
MLVDRSAAITAQAVLSEEDFYAPEHKIIFNAIDKVINKGLEIDLATVVDELVATKDLSTIGDVDYLSSLEDLAMNPSQIDQYIKILQDKTIVRKMIDFATKLPEAWNTDASNSVEDFVADQESMFLDITRSRKVGDFQTSKEVLDVMKAKMAESARNPKGLTGVTSGFSDLDGVTLGWQKGDMIILAARPSMGKTALALNFLVNAAFKERRTVAIFSVEMPAEQLMQRLIASRSGVDGKKIRKGEMTDRESMKVDSAMNELSSIKLFIDDKTSTMADIGVRLES